MINWLKMSVQHGFRIRSQKASCAVVYWLSMRTHNAGVVSSKLVRVTIKTSLVKKATENHLIKSTSLEKTQSPVSGFS